MAETFKPDVLFLCPFCGVKCGASSQGDTPGVMHAMPMCERFEKTADPVEFMAACNEAFRRSAPTGRYAGFEPAYLEAYATHEAFRRLGFSSDQIFVHRNPAPLLDLMVVVRHHGTQFAVSVGRVEDDWQTRWGDMVALVRSDPGDHDLRHIWESSLISRHTVGLILDLEAKGIEPPLGKD